MRWAVGINRDRLGLISGQLLAGGPFQEIGHVPGDVCLGWPGSRSLSADAAGVLPQGEAERLPGQ
jgi:hypothetical protein